jgi:DNA (cytosine-5)-methyltransferase 1
MTNPLLLDLFCCAGGAARGYANAGFNIVGIDMEPQPKYPYPFLQMDALLALDSLLKGSYLPFGEAWHGLNDFTALHASPPCQRFSSVSACVPGTREKYPDLIDPVRTRFTETGIPWVIENVRNAPMRSPLILCGTMFGLGYGGFTIRRHRLFETSFIITAPGSCDHSKPALDPYGNKSRQAFKAVYGIDMRRGAWQEAMGLPGMPQTKATEAIPPAYTEYIGTRLLSLTTVA